MRESLLFDPAHLYLGHADDFRGPVLGQAVVVAQPDDPAHALQQLPPARTAPGQELIAQAETQGYIRGRNEQIEATQHFDDTAPGCDISPSSMPHYGRCSIWDL